MAVTAEEGIRQRLIADGTVSGLVSTRVYVGDPPQNAALPLVTMQRTSANHEHQMLAASGRVNPQIQVDGYATSRSGAMALGDAIRLALDGFTGAVTVGASSITFQQLHLVSDSTPLIEPDDASDRRIHRVSHDYDCWHSEVVPTF